MNSSGLIINCYSALMHLVTSACITVSQTSGDGISLHHPQGC